MLKIIDPSWDFGEPIADIVHVTAQGLDRQWMQKRATCFGKDLSTESVPKDHTLLHINAVGDYETYGVNLNGDGFTARGGIYKGASPKPGGPTTITIDVGNEQTHDTFVKKGKVYRNHKNSDPKYSCGTIVKSAYNDRMKRTELLIALPNNEFADDLQKLASGDPLAFSMSCRVPYDICNVCLNKSASRKEYCDHAKNHLTDILKSGHQVGVLNDHMVFFDISRVVRPADRIARTLRFQKAASLSEAATSSAELAELAGLKTPDWLLHSGEPKMVAALNAVRKLAAIEKEIPATIGEDVSEAAGKEDIPEDIVEKFMDYLPQDVLDAASEAKICLPLKTFLKLVTRNKVPRDAEKAEDYLPGMFSRFEDNDMMGDIAGPASGVSLSSPSAMLNQMMRHLSDAHSMGIEPRVKRMVIIRISKPEGRVKTASVRSSLPPEPARTALTAYAAYQLDLVSKHPDLAELVVLGNYL